MTEELEEELLAGNPDPQMLGNFAMKYILNVRQDNPELFVKLLNAGLNVNFTNEDFCILSSAMLFGLVEIVKLLVQSGANVNITVKDTPLIHFAIVTGSFDIVNSLIEAGANVNAHAEKQSNQTPLIVAASKHDKIDIVKLLLDSDANVHLTNVNGVSPLIACIGNNKSSARMEIVNLLIQSGADVNLQDNDGWTALMYAARYMKENFIECFEALLAAGAKLNLQNKNGGTALMWAVSHTNPLGVEKLITAGANVNIKGCTGQTALSFVHMIRNIDDAIEITKLLVLNGANINHQDDDGDTIFHDLIVDWFELFFKLEEVFKPDLNLRNKTGKSVLDLFYERYGLVQKFCLKLL